MRRPYNSRVSGTCKHWLALFLNLFAYVPAERAEAQDELRYAIPPPLTLTAPVAWTHGAPRFRFEAAVGPAFGTQFTLASDSLPDGADVNTCSVGASATLGFRWNSILLPKSGLAGVDNLLRFPLLGWVFFPLLPFFAMGPSGVWGNQIGADLHLTALSYCNGQGARYSIGLRPVFLVTPTNRVRLPSFLGVVLPEPILVLETGLAPTFELGVVHFPVDVLLSQRVGLSFEPILGYRFSFNPAVPAAVTLQFSLALIIR